MEVGTIPQTPYLHEEEEKNDDKHTDIGMEPNGRPPQDLGVVCVLDPSEVVKESADGFPRHQLQWEKAIREKPVSHH